MFNKTIFLITALILLYSNLTLSNLAQEIQQTFIKSRYPDYAQMYVGKDKFENFNRKMFIFNNYLNKSIMRPVNVVWSSIMPKYGIERIQKAYINLEYPKRFVSCLIQKDFNASKTETLRFLTNTTLGIGGLFDPAQKYFKLNPTTEDIDQALAKCKIKSGPYLVIPVIASTSPRALISRITETALDPSVYIASPIAAFIKLSILVNKTTYIQPLVKMLESTYADPYDIMKKLYGLEFHIKTANLDRNERLKPIIDSFHDDWAVKSKNDLLNISNISLRNCFITQPLKENITIYDEDKYNIKPDIVLQDFNPQNPIVDAMRTALFEVEGIYDSKWNDLSVWNRSFYRRIKTSSISIDSKKDRYKYKYIMQKDKGAPVAIIYPSIGEGVNSHHSIVLAKIFYEQGYSVILQGSHFHWQFVKSMPNNYKPGLPSKDVEYIHLVTSKILNSLQNKYKCEFKEKVVIGTSFGALSTLFLANKEYYNNTLNISKYISINPPIELIFALRQLDKNNEIYYKDSDIDIKEKTTITAAKITYLSQLKKFNKNIESLPFSETEGKIITAFILRQKLSDLIFTIENTSKTKKTDFYQKMNNTSYEDYAKKYLLQENYKNIKDVNYQASLHSISEFLIKSNNYKIYHSLDDYFINKKQLSQLKEYSGNKLVCLNHGSHLGFLYRKEFIEDLKSQIALKEEI